VDVPTKWHKNFVARRGEMLTQIAADYGGVSISLPRNGSNSETIKLSGAKECVAGAKQRILEIVDDLVSAGSANRVADRATRVCRGVSLLNNLTSCAIIKILTYPLCLA